MATVLLAVLATAAAAPPAGAQARKTSVYRARHILLPWKGSAGAGPGTTRSKSEALKLSTDLVARIRNGESFADLAKQHSSGPSRYEGGDLGQFKRHEMYDFFVKWVERAKVGEILGPLESRFGYHVVERLAVEKPWPDLVAASHIMISFQGALHVPEGVKRSRQEARLLAGRVLGEIKAGKIAFEDAARRYSDDASTKSTGGSLGVRRPATCITMRCADSICALKVGAIGGPIETPFGFHIVRRDKLELPLRAAHILLAWKGAKRAPEYVKRSKKEALELAKKIYERAMSGEDFAKLAREHSDGLSKSRGGDLGEFYKGEMLPAFAKAVSKADVGTIVGPVETPHGYHIILRLK